MAQPAGHSKPFARGSLILIGLAWSLPFLQSRHGYPLTAFYSEWLAFGLGLAAALLLLTRQSWRDAQMPVVALAPPAFALVLGVQATLGLLTYPEQAVTATLYLLWAALLILLAYVLVRELGLATIATALAWFLLAGGLLNALAGYAQHGHITFGFDFLVTRKVAARVYGNIGQPNQYAAYLTMALCSTAYLYGSGRMRAGGAIACAAALLPAIALSGSRGPWFYLVISSVLAWLLFRARREMENRRLLIYVLGLFPGFVFAALLASQWTGTALATVATIVEPVSSTQRLFDAASGLARVDLAQEAWQMFLSAPVLGVGWGQFAWHHFTHVATAGVTAAPGVYNHAHNVVLHLLAETGMAGGLIVIGAISLWVVDLRRIRLDLEWWWIVALLAILGAHSMVEHPLWYSYFLGMVAVLLGLGAQRTIRLTLPSFARLTVAILMLAGWFNLVSVMPQYREFERLVFHPGNSAAQTDEKGFTEAMTRIYREPILAPYVELALAFAFSMDEKNLAEKLAMTSRVVRFAPVSYVTYRESLLLAIGGEQEAALHRLDQAIRAYPEDLLEMRSELVRLSRSRPDVFAPLLELATGRLPNARPLPNDR